jgi:SAM-dependent MidA family methyltransferase
LPSNADFPAPTAEALAHGERLRALIAGEIAKAGGWISFSRFMELALYAPGLGYYSAGAEKFGAAGDFVTAPEISSLFGTTLASQVAELITADTPDVLELGAGSGKLACDVLIELRSLDKLPQRYLILESSADLRQRQQKTVKTRVPNLYAQVQWLDSLPASFHGVVVANEVLDALPVHVVAWRDDEIAERGVTIDQKQNMSWAEKPLHGDLLATARAAGVQQNLHGSDYVSEINTAAPALIATLSDMLGRGVMIFIDYGFPRHEYYHPQRASGTLMCHYRHRAHDDPFYLPGLQDITAHVDFTAIRDAALGRNLSCLGFVTQAQFLINCGITDVMTRVSPADPVRYLPLAAQAQKLLSPSEMGELFKVIAFGRGVDPVLKGFAAGDMSARLG